MPLHHEKPSKTIEKPRFFKVFADFHFIHFGHSWTLSGTRFCFKTGPLDSFWRPKDTKWTPSWVPRCVLGGPRGGQRTPFPTLERALNHIDAPLGQFWRYWTSFSLNFRAPRCNFPTFWDSFWILLHVQKSEKNDINTASWSNEIYSDQRYMQQVFTKVVNSIDHSYWDYQAKPRTLDQS